MEMGVAAENGRRLQRALYVHSVGLNQLFRDNLHGCTDRTKVLGYLWIVYQHLLENVCKSEYKTLVYELTESLQ
jgi:hypothetical protein